MARLTAVEELAGMDVLCSDKTGTLTLNKLTVGEPIVVSDDQEIEPEVCLIRFFRLLFANTSQFFRGFSFMQPFLQR